MSPEQFRKCIKNTVDVYNSKALNYEYNKMVLKSHD